MIVYFHVEVFSEGDYVDSTTKYTKYFLRSMIVQSSRFNQSDVFTSSLQQNNLISTFKIIFSNLNRTQFTDAETEQNRTEENERGYVCRASETQRRIRLPRHAGQFTLEPTHCYKKHHKACPKRRILPAQSDPHKPQCPPRLKTFTSHHSSVTMFYHYPHPQRRVITQVH